MKIDLLAIGVHPDDVELSAGGTLLRHAAQGKTFGLADLTRGELGTRGTPEIRRREALDAARLLGAAFREALDLPDGLFTYHPDQWLKVVRLLRTYQPDIVLCNAPDDRHPDHGRGAKLIADACFYSGLLRIETQDADGQLQPPWRPKGVYHYIQDKHLEPDFIVDITPWFQQKMDAIAAFRSQFYTGTDEDREEPATPISGEDFIEFMKAKARVFGRPAQYRYAEGFIHSRTPGVRSLVDLE
jgi:bacillithiol biosynthesis deacetylase BshB1